MPVRPRPVLETTLMSGRGRNEPSSDNYQESIAVVYYILVYIYWRGKLNSSVGWWQWMGGEDVAHQLGISGHVVIHFSKPCVIYSLG